MRFSYTATTSETTSRHVEPHWLVSLGRRWYLVAFDLRRDDWRTFRVDRIDGARATGMRFHRRRLPREDQDPAAFVRASIGSVAAPQWSVEALVKAPAERVRSQLPQWASIGEVDADTCRLSMTLSDLSWAALALGSLGAEFQVVRPAELLAYLAEWSARFARAAAAQ